MFFGKVARQVYKKCFAYDHCKMQTFTFIKFSTKYKDELNFELRAHGHSYNVSISNVHSLKENSRCVLTQLYSLLFERSL